MCTILSMKTKKGFLLGKNNDTLFKDGILFTNKRGVEKSALIIPPCKPLVWTAKYGSLSFSQCGKELPVGGMNEAGLVVEQATLPETQYPDYKGGAGIGELQLIQYLLDTCANVQQAVQYLEQVEICQPTWPIHYVLADASGDMAVIEYIQGERKTYIKNDILVKVVTNSRYDKVTALNSQDDSYIQCDNEYEYNSLERLRKAVDILNSTEYFDIYSAFIYLEKLERIDTVWNIVYDLESLKIFFRTENFREIKSVSLSKIDFNKKSQSKLLHLSYNTGGNINCKFVNYSKEQNKELIFNFFKDELLVSVMGLAVPDELMEYLSLYPELLEEVK